MGQEKEVWGLFEVEVEVAPEIEVEYFELVAKEVRAQSKFQLALLESEL